MRYVLPLLAVAATNIAVAFESRRALPIRSVPFRPLESTPNVEATTSTTLPTTKEQMIAAAVEAVKRAKADGVNNQRLRILLPSPRQPGVLIAPDETWEGGIMQLYQTCSPLVRDLVRALSPSSGSVVARLREQRLDESGVDGEGLWTSECASAADDVSALVQPSSEQQQNIEAVCKSANGRLVLMVNPQYVSFLSAELGISQNSSAANAVALPCSLTARLGGYDGLHREQDGAEVSVQQHSI